MLFDITLSMNLFTGIYSGQLKTNDVKWKEYLKKYFYHIGVQITISLINCAKLFKNIQLIHFIESHYEHKLLCNLESEIRTHTAYNIGFICMISNMVTRMEHVFINIIADYSTFTEFLSPRYTMVFFLWELSMVL